MHNFLFDISILSKCLSENMLNKAGYLNHVPLGSSLRYLDLSHNFLGSHNDCALEQIILFNRSLSHLSLQRCWLTNTPLFLRALAKNFTLVSLNISQNPIRNESIGELAYSMEQNSTLQILLMLDVPVIEEGGELLASSLTWNQALKILYLSNTMVSTRVCADMMEGFSKSSLRVLRWHNQMVIPKPEASKFLVLETEFGPRVDQRSMEDGNGRLPLEMIIQSCLKQEKAGS